MLDAQANDAEIFAFFDQHDPRALQAADLAEAASELRKRMVPVDLSGDPVDTCGTGGSGKQRINASTIAAFVAAAGGAKIAKHGNKSAGGKCGSFDLLEKLGAKIDLNPEQEQRIYNELGIVFLFARAHHPAMRHVAAARSAYGKPTIFNLLGPLCNPARIKRQIVGVSSVCKPQTMAEALRLLGADGGCVVHGEDGLDEVTVTGPTTTVDVASGKASQFKPEKIGLKRHAEADVRGGDIEENVRIARLLASGKGTKAHQDLVCVNAAYALLIAGKTKSLSDALAIAQTTLASGAVEQLISRYVQSSNQS